MKATFPIQGIDCVSCATIVQNKSSKLEGVTSCYVDVQNNTVTYEYNEDKISPAEINNELQKYGYTIVYESEKSSEDIQEATKSIEYRNLMISIPLVIIGLIDMTWMIGAGQGWREPMSEPLHKLFRNFLLASATIMLFVVGQKYLQAVRRYFRYGVVSMDTLVGLGTGVAFVYSFIVDSFSEPLSKYIDTSMVYYEAVIVVIGFISLGKYLEHRTMTKSGQAIKALLNLQAKKAIRVHEDTSETEVDVEDLYPGDIVRIKSGEKVPLDCIIQTGSADIDESMITGETLPVTKQVGDQLIGGTVNINGSLLATISATSADGYLAKIVDVVTIAQQSRPAIQALVDRIMKWFVPLVLCVAIGSCLIWLFFGEARVGDKYISIAVASFIGVLVIACPCGIGLATPMAVTTGVGHLAKNGILCKDARGLLKLRKATSFIFDKTGTLTEGKPRVLAETYYGDEQHIKEILFALESEANHPLAHAVTAHLANYGGASVPTVEDFVTLIGAGVSGKIAGEAYTVASPKWVRNNGYDIDEDIVTSYTKQAMTPVCLVNDAGILAILGLADTLKAEAIETIKQIQAQGKQAIIISGDHTNVVEAIANQLGITQRYAEVTPEDKAKIVQSISNKTSAGEACTVDEGCCPSESEQKKEIKNSDFVVMIGDGINDAPALAQADVGIAMSTGTDIAIESSDMTLLHGDISKLLKAMKISDLTHSAIVQNLMWAFSYNIVGIPLAAGALYLPFGLLLNPAFEGAAMAMSDLAVIGNSVRLQKKKI